MRVGILTFAAVPNFGANLQALSTFHYFKNQGHDPIVINWMPSEFKESLEKLCKTNNQSACHLLFVKETMIFTSECEDSKDVARIIDDNKIDVIVVGSDAVLQHHSLLERIHFPAKKIFWVHKMSKTRLFPNPFWGDFSPYLKKKVPMAIMSASSQGSKYGLFMGSIRKKMFERLREFSFISVRDDWTKKMVSFISGRKIIPEVTPDPVFAFNYNCGHLIPSRDDILNKFGLPQKYVLFSLLHKSLVPYEWMNEFNDAATENGYSVVVLPMPNGVGYEHPFEYEVSTPLSPLDWYALIRYSCGYIGQNMHPTVVALANSVPVYCFDSYVLPKWFGLLANDAASKVFHILSVFEHPGNRCSVGYRNCVIPKPKTIFEKIEGFNKELCQEHFQKYLDSYCSMMKKMESSLGMSV